MVKNSNNNNKILYLIGEKLKDKIVKKTFISLTIPNKKNLFKRIGIKS